MRCRSIKYLCFIALAFILQSNFSYANDSDVNDYYQKGLSAYFGRDYEEAKFQWLQGAKKGEVKSMFNLGLLHEQSRINNSDLVKAEEWFSLAGKAGYLPADYHLALRIISNDGDQQRADDLLNNAASKGFVPALNYLNGDDLGILEAISKANTSAQGGDNSLERKKSSPERKNSLEHKNSPEGNASNAKPVVLSQNRPTDYLSESWILSKRPNYWTIQLLVFSDEVKVKAFIKDNKLNDKAAYFLEKTDKKEVYKLIYGAYKTKDLADFSRQNLPEDLKLHGPWLRSIESVQSLIKAK